MQKPLEILIKLHDRELKLKQRELANLQNQKSQLLKAMDELHHEILKEQIYARSNPDSLIYYTYFAEKNFQFQEKIRNSINEIEQEIEALSEEIYEKFTEIKKYQILLKNHLTANQLKQIKDDEKAIDEATIMRYKIDQN